MSEIRATTISDAAGTGPVTLTGQSAPKAWINFNGTGTIATRSSFNISSITDSGTGIYRVDYTNAMSNGNYPTISAVAQYTPFPIAQAYIGTTNASYQILNNAQPGTADYDTDTVNAAMMGDLA